MRLINQPIELMEEQKTSLNKDMKNEVNAKKIEKEGSDYAMLGKFKYNFPGKRQRVVVASVVLFSNLFLVLAVLLYLKNPAFQELIYNFGRN